jgi:glutathione synthase/RimK-type ligase-like ATP-grasp enzyme
LRGSPFPWVNDPDAAVRADDKLHQLAVARRLGLPIPATLVTNDPEELRRFHREHGRLIAKSISGSHGLPASKRILTNVVTKADLARAGSLRHAPVCFQEYVPKASELRVTVIGQAAYAVRIHSQARARTRDDWRRYGPGLDYSVAKLPRAVERKCIAVAKDLHLDYGGIDLVERPDGKHVFLEINSLPAWLWLEDATGLGITAAFADHLERRAGKGRGRP